MNSWIHIAVWAVVIGVAFGLLWWQGQIQRLSLYWQETVVELQKCSWPTWQELRDSTLLIAITVAILGIFVVVIDQILFHIFIR